MFLMSLFIAKNRQIYGFSLSVLITCTENICAENSIELKETIERVHSCRTVLDRISNCVAVIDKNVNNANDMSDNTNSKL